MVSQKKKRGGHEESALQLFCVSVASKSAATFYFETGSLNLRRSRVRLSPKAERAALRRRAASTCGEGRIKPAQINSLTR